MVLKRRRKGLAVLLVFCLLFTSFFGVGVDDAEAIVLADDVIYVIAAALIACGYICFNTDSVAASAYALWNNASHNLKQALILATVTGKIALGSLWEEVNNFVENSHTVGEIEYYEKVLESSYTHYSDDTGQWTTNSEEIIVNLIRTDEATIIINQPEGRRYNTRDIIVENTNSVDSDDWFKLMQYKTAGNTDNVLHIANSPVNYDGSPFKQAVAIKLVFDGIYYKVWDITNDRLLTTRYCDFDIYKIRFRWKPAEINRFESMTLEFEGTMGASNTLQSEIDYGYSQPQYNTLELVENIPIVQDWSVPADVVDVVSTGISYSSADGVIPGEATGSIVSSINNVISTVSSLPATIASSIAAYFVPTMTWADVWGPIQAKMNDKFPTPLQPYFVNLFIDGSPPKWYIKNFINDKQELLIDWADYDNLVGNIKSWCGAIMMILTCVFIIRTFRPQQTVD